MEWFILRVSFAIERASSSGTVDLGMGETRLMRLNFSYSKRGCLRGSVCP